eukprot:jgi/Ulvmu1/11646/UM008_0050.1
MWLAVVSLLCGLHAVAAVSEDVGFRQWLADNHAQKLAQPQMTNTSLSVITRDDGSLGLAEVPDELKRPFKLAYYNAMDPTQTEETVQYVMGTIMPAAASLFRRFIRVRYPSGKLRFENETDLEGFPIPTGPNGDGIDADLLIKVTSYPVDTEFCKSSLAAALPVVYETLTRRALFGQVWMCQIQPRYDFSSNLATVLHELTHVIGIADQLFPQFFGYNSGVNDIIGDVQLGPPLPFFVEPRDGIVTDNTVREARLHTGCPTLTAALLENDVGVGAHWDLRVFRGELMNPAGVNDGFHISRHVMTDLSLGLMQDSGWYDVKYGSGGFNSYGWQGGCEFANGTFRSAFEDPAAKRYLCSPRQFREYVCLHDFSGDGTCDTLASIDNFYTAVADTNTFDCQSVPGARCYKDPGDEFAIPQCLANMSCSPQGQVLVDGVPCSDFLAGCPPDDEMCLSPGYLTCATPALNDCNAHGDCFEGSCYCHMGWGGADCSVRVCTSECDDGSKCPPSGFCGVPDCGEWSVGDTGKGVPCQP